MLRVVRDRQDIEGDFAPLMIVDSVREAMKIRLAHVPIHDREHLGEGFSLLKDMLQFLLEAQVETWCAGGVPLLRFSDILACGPAETDPWAMRGWARFQL